MEPRHTKPLKTQRPTGRTVQRRVQRAGKAEKPVEFLLHWPDAQSVFVAGTFNQWDPQKTPLDKEPQGMWKITVSLSPGRYEYRFVVDGQWLSDPKAQASVPNDYGSTNSVVAV